MMPLLGGGCTGGVTPATPRPGWQGPGLREWKWGAGRMHLRKKIGGRGREDQTRDSDEGRGAASRGDARSGRDLPRLTCWGVLWGKCRWAVSWYLSKVAIVRALSSGPVVGVVSQRKGATFLWEPPAPPVQSPHHFPMGP